jgi:beta-xylosidase
VQVARSADLVHWENLPDGLPVLPDWAATRPGYVWSPVVARPAAGNHYVLYYVARYNIGASGTQAIGAAIGEDPAGPFTPVGDAPLICQGDEGGTIDPHVFIEDDGTRYLLWKNDGNSLGLPTWLYIQRLSDDGLSLEGPRMRLLTASEPWEGCLVEAPSLWKRGHKYYLFYSANCYANDSYAIGYAEADCIWGPYRKSEQPLLGSDRPNGLIGPGGQDVVFGPQGDTWMIYHAWTQTAPARPGGILVDRGYRHVRLSRLAWSGDVPRLQGAGCEAQPLP